MIIANDYLEYAFRMNRAIVEQYCKEEPSFFGKASTLTGRANTFAKPKATRNVLKSLFAEATILDMFYSKLTANTQCRTLNGVLAQRKSRTENR